MVERRVAWRVAILGLDPRRLVLVDETWAKTNMARARGRAQIGQRLVDRVPHGHWQTTTFISALRQNELAASVVMEGAVNGERFLVYIREHLAPKLTRGDIEVMDNLSSPKAEGVREAIEAAGARIAYLPPYSADLNPLEQNFANLRALLRGYRERTVERTQPPS